jgi:autotransporter-associated beta strand protein
MSASLIGRYYFRQQQHRHQYRIVPRLVTVDWSRIANNAALAFNRSDDVTYGGVISGTGSLTQAGSGQLTLTGTNTFTGGTTVNGD